MSYATKQSAERTTLSSRSMSPFRPRRKFKRHWRRDRKNFSNFSLLSSKETVCMYDCNVAFFPVKKYTCKFSKLNCYGLAARFALKKPVPDIGDVDTPISQVYKFYEYWVRFDSWRDFTGMLVSQSPKYTIHNTTHMGNHHTQALEPSISRKTPTAERKSATCRR
jgi:hypothetical protein